MKKKNYQSINIFGKWLKKKNRLISKFEKVMKEMAIDCELFHSKNETYDDIINCSD